MSPHLEKFLVIIMPECNREIHLVKINKTNSTFPSLNLFTLIKIKKQTPIRVPVWKGFFFNYKNCVDFQPHRIPSFMKLNSVSLFIKTNIISRLDKYLISSDIHLLVLLSTGIYCSSKLYSSGTLETIPFLLNYYAHESEILQTELIYRDNGRSLIEDILFSPITLFSRFD